MTAKEIKNTSFELSSVGIHNPKVYWNLAPAVLIQHTLSKGQGELTNSGALSIETGKFTGRSPKDRYIVEDEITQKQVHWGNINIPMTSDQYDRLEQKVLTHLNAKEEIYARDCFACANLKYRLNIRVVTEHPWQNLFAHNMFLRPAASEIEDFQHEWMILAAPGCMAVPEIDGTRQENFAVINFTKKRIIIGGTAYTGEIKKGIFSVLNFALPVNDGVFPMHCSANVGEHGDTALFFGLSGTGKTTLSTDPERKLIGDDEHGWSKTTVFNFEGGCYAKTINLSASKEPEIFKAIKFGAMVENMNFKDSNSHILDFEDATKTQNTRVSYPINHIDNIVFNSRGNTPQNIFFLTCDAFGVLPPISKLTNDQAMYYFLLGYTAKVAGTEAGIDEPQATFSSCFGLPFLPLNPTTYAKMLGEKLEKAEAEGKPIKVWLVNTGWSGGPVGEGRRMELPYTRAMIKAALNGAFKDVAFTKEAHFGLQIPTECPDVPSHILDPKQTWKKASEYEEKATSMVNLFKKEFVVYSNTVTNAVNEVL